MTSTIDPQADCITLINVFTVEPARQQELIDILNEATEQVMRHRRGFISANIHRGTDGTRVANYAQWASQDALAAMLADPVAQEHMARCTAIAVSTPVLYQVDAVHRS